MNQTSNNNQNQQSQLSDDINEELRIYEEAKAYSPYISSEAEEARRTRKYLSNRGIDADEILAQQGSQIVQQLPEEKQEDQPVDTFSNERLATLYQKGKEQNEAEVLDRLYEWKDANERAPYIKEQRIIRAQLHEELLKMGVDPVSYWKKKERERVIAILEETASVSLDLMPGMYGQLDPELARIGRLQGLVSPDQIDRWNKMSDLERDGVVIDLLKKALLPEKDWNIDDNSFKIAFTNHFKKETFDEAKREFFITLANQKDEFDIMTQTADFLSDYVYASGGDVKKAVASMDEENRKYGYQIIQNAPWLASQYQTAYNTVEELAKTFEKGKRPDFNLISEKLLELSQSSNTFQFALDFLIRKLPVDDRTWLTQSIEDCAHSSKSLIELMALNGATEVNAERLALAIQNEWKAKRDMPTSWWGQGLRSTVMNLPQMVIVTAASIGAGAAVAGTGGAAAPVVVAGASALAGGVTGAVVYGSEAGLNAFKEGTSVGGSLAYGITVGAGEGILEVATLKAGKGLAMLAKQTATTGAFTRVSQWGVGQAIGKAGRAFAKSRAGQITIGGATGVAGELSQEISADPYAIISSELFEAAGIRIEGQQTLGEWWRTFDLTDPNFICPIVLLGGSLGAVGGYSADSKVVQLSRNSQALITLGVPPAIANQIAVMPDSQTRTNYVAETLAQTRVDPETFQVTGSGLSSFLTMLARNTEHFRNVRNMPDYTNNGDGTITIREKGKDGKISEFTLAEDIAATYLSDKLRANPDFIEALDVFAENEQGRAFRNEARSMGNNELVQQLMQDNAINESVANTRGMSVIASNPTLQVQYNSGGITLSEVASTVTTTNVFQSEVMNVARYSPTEREATETTTETSEATEKGEGKAKSPLLRTLDRVVRARAIDTIGENGINRQCVEDSVRSYLEWTGRTAEEIGDLTNDDVLFNHLSDMAQAIATQPEFLQNMPPNVTTVLEWQKDAIAEVGTIFRQGAMMREAMDRGILPKEFTRWSKNLVSSERSREGIRTARDLNAAAGTTVISVPENRRTRNKGGLFRKASTTTIADGTNFGFSESQTIVSTLNLYSNSTVELNIASARDPQSLEYIKKSMKKWGLNEDEQNAILKVLEYCTNEVEKIIKSNDFDSISDWQMKEINREVVNKIVFPIVSAFKQNGDYDANADFSTLCTKREALDAAVQILIKEGLGRKLGMNKIFQIKNALRDFQYAVACEICFVETKRYRALGDATKLAWYWNTIVDLIHVDNKQMGSPRELSAETKTILEEMVNNPKEAFEKYIPEEARRSPEKMDYGLTSYMMNKIAKVMLAAPTSIGTMEVTTLMSSQGVDYLMSAFGVQSGMRELLAGAFGTATAKPTEGYSPYDPMSWREFDGKRLEKWRKEIFDIGGVRMQSFSDFNPKMVLDYLQFFADLSLRNLPLHTYTKVPSFIQIFGKSGAMFNMSLVPGIDPDSSIPGLDKDGNYVWHKDSFPVDLAMQYRKDPAYGGRVGTIAVGISDGMIRKMLDDPEIDMIIPYHKSGMPPSTQIVTGLGKATDYTSEQSTRRQDGTALKKDKFKYNEALQELGDPRKAARAYLEYCEKNNYIPKFDQFVDHPNYYKLLEDFRGYDNEGKPVIQQGVRMDFVEDPSFSASISEAMKAQESLSRRYESMYADKQFIDTLKKICETNPLEGDLRKVVEESLSKALTGKLTGGVTTLNGVDFQNLLQGQLVLSRQARDAGHAKEILETWRKQDGVIYGFTHDGKIYLNELTYNANTPAHEFTHIWSKVAQLKNPELWKQGVALLEKTDEWNQVVNDPLYKGMLNNKDAIASEVLARITGKIHEEFLEQINDPNAKPLRLKGYYAKIKDFLKDMWREVRSIFDSKVTRELTYEEFSRMPLRDLYDTTRQQEFAQALQEINKTPQEIAFEIEQVHEDMLGEAETRQDSSEVATTEQRKEEGEMDDGIFPDEQARMDFDEKINELVNSMSDRASGRLIAMKNGLMNLSVAIKKDGYANKRAVRSLAQTIISLDRALIKDGVNPLSEATMATLLSGDFNEKYYRTLNVAVDTMITAVAERNIKQEQHLLEKLEAESKAKEEKTRKKEQAKLVRDKLREKLEAQEIATDVVARLGNIDLTSTVNLMNKEWNEFAEIKKEISDIAHGIVQEEILKEDKLAEALKEAIIEEREAKRRAEAEEQELRDLSLKGLARLAEKAYKDTKGSSRTLDAEARAITKQIEVLMHMSPADINVMREQVEARLDELEKEGVVKKTEEEILKEVLDKAAEGQNGQTTPAEDAYSKLYQEMLELENQRNLLDTFGSVMYFTQRVEGGWKRYARSAEEMRNARLVLDNIQHEGRLRRKQYNDEIKAYYDKFNNELQNTLRNADTADSVRRDLEKSGKLSAMKAFFSSWLSGVQLLECLKTFKAFENAGQFLQDQMIRAQIDRSSNKIKTEDTILNIITEAREIAGAKNKFQYMNDLLTKEIKFKGFTLTKAGWIKVYQTLREPDGMEILSKNYTLLEKNGIDFGNFRYYDKQIAMFQKNIHELDVQLDNAGISQQKYDEDVATLEKAIMVLEGNRAKQLAEDKAELLNIIGADGSYIADRLAEEYRKIGKKYTAYMAEKYGQHVVLNDFYTPRNIARAGSQLNSEDMVDFAAGGFSRTGLPSYAKKRMTPSNAKVVMEINPFSEFSRYSMIMSNWMTAGDLIDFNNRVWANPVTSEALKKILGESDYRVATRALSNFINNGRIKARDSWWADMLTKVMATLAKTKIFYSLASIVRSGAAIMNPLVGTNFSLWEIIKGIATITRGNQGLTIEELTNLPAMHERKFRSGLERALIQEAGRQTVSKNAAFGYWQECGTSALMKLDTWSATLGNALAAHMLAKRGLSKEEITFEMNKNLYISAQPLNSLTKPIMLDGGSGFEGYGFLFLSDPMQKLGISIMHLKSRNGNLLWRSGQALKVFLLVGIANGLANMLASGFMNDDDDLTGESLFYTVLISPIANIPFMAGLADMLDRHLLGGGHYFVRKDWSFDVAKAGEQTYKFFDKIINSGDTPVTPAEVIDYSIDMGKILGRVTPATSMFESMRAITKSFELIAAMSNMTNQIKNAVYKTLGESNPILREKDILAIQYEELTTEIEKAKKDGNEVTVKVLSDRRAEIRKEQLGKGYVKSNQKDK